MALQISTTIDLVNSGVAAYLAVRLFRAWHQDPASRTLKNFAYTYALLTLAYVTLFVPRLLASEQTALLGIAFAFGNFFFLTACAFFGRIVVQFTRPLWVRPYAIVYHILTLACLAWALIQRAAPVTDSVTGITQWNVNPGVGALGGLLLLVVLIPGSVLFLHRGALARDNHIVRVRSLTIGIGGVLLALTAITFYLAETETLAVIGDLMSIGALLTVFLGVIYHRPRKLPPLPPSQPQPHV